MSRSLLRLVVAIGATSVLSLPAQSQEPPIFGEEMDVRVVNIEVVVTDRDGKRVPDLKPADFRLRVDGKDVPIEYFSEIQEGRSAAPAEGQPAAAGGVQSLAPEGTVGTYYLVFIDDFFSVPPRRNDVLKAMKAELSRLGPDDRMAVVAYDGGRLAMLANWSGSRSDLDRAFDQAMARAAHGFERVVERRDLRSNEEFARAIESATARQGGDLAMDPTLVRATNVGLNDREKGYAETLVRQMRGSVGAAVSAMRGFGAPRGRKVMLLLSGGWPFSVVSYIRGAETVAPSRQTASGEDIFRTLTSTANLLGYTLYPVDVPGVQTTAADAEAGAPADTGFAGVGEQEIEGSLYFLAKETGGKPILNTNRTVALASASADTRSYYWLGFSPDWQRNDKLHAVKVDVARPGLELRYRTGFRDLSRKAEVSMKVESALLFGNFPGALPMPMRLGTVVKSKKGGLEIPVTLGLPADVMTVLPVGGKYAAKLELRFAASDASGNSSEIPIFPLDLVSDKPPAPGKFVRYETTLRLKGKADHLVVAVYDPLSGKVATAEAEIKAP
jgi:VWFA-related protein